MLVDIVSFLGAVAGYFTGKFTEEELKPGKIYFLILEIIILFALVILSLIKEFNFVLFFLGIIAGIFFRFEYFYFGIILGNGINFLDSALVFVYGLPYGTLAFYKNNFKKIFYGAVLFVIGSLAFLSSYNLLPFAAGGIATILVLTIKKLFH